MINRLHLYFNQEIAKKEFHKAKETFDTGKYGPFKVIISDLVIECQDIKVQLRGIHDLELFLRGRTLDKVVSFTHLNHSQEMAIHERLLNSKILRPFEYYTELKI